MNVRTSAATYFLHNKKLRVEGTFATACPGPAGQRREAQVAQLHDGRAQSQREPVELAPGERDVRRRPGRFYLGPHGQKTCEGVVKTDLSSAIVAFQGWTFDSRQLRVRSIGGASHRLDMSVHAGPDAVGPMHGIVGHAFDPSAKYTMGKQDVYPDAGSFAPPPNARGRAGGAVKIRRGSHQRVRHAKSGLCHRRAAGAQERERFFIGRVIRKPSQKKQMFLSFFYSIIRSRKRSRPRGNS